MKNQTVERAVEVGKLKHIQHTLAVGGSHKEARTLGEQIQPIHKQAALDYLGVKELPAGVNGSLVEELAVKVAAVSDGTKASKLRGLLRRAAWSKKAETSGKLVRAHAALPDLKKVQDALQ